MTPQEWNHALRPEVPTIDAYKAIGKVARAHLQANVLLDDTVSTRELIEALYPERFAKQSEEGMAARKRMVKAFSWRALAIHDLADCVTPGKPQRIGPFKRLGTPCLWHAPKTKVGPVCPHCGEELL